MEPTSKIIAIDELNKYVSLFPYVSIFKDVLTLKIDKLCFRLTLLNQEILHTSYMEIKLKLHVFWFRNRVINV